MPDDFGLCWCCQRDITDKTAVWIDEHQSIQCCRSCWKKIPEPKRVEIALAFHDRSERGLGIEETLAVIRDLIHSANHGYFERRMDSDERMN